MPHQELCLTRSYASPVAMRSPRVMPCYELCVAKSCASAVVMPRHAVCVAKGSVWPELSLRNEKNGMVKDVCDVPGLVAEVVEPLCSTRIFGVSVSVVLLAPR